MGGCEGGAYCGEGIDGVGMWFLINRWGGLGGSDVSGRYLIEDFICVATV